MGGFPRGGAAPTSSVFPLTKTVGTATTQITAAAAGDPTLTQSITDTAAPTVLATDTMQVSSGVAASKVFHTQSGADDALLAITAGGGVQRHQFTLQGANALDLTRTSGGGPVRIGLYGTTPVARPAAIAAPSGGATIDTQARAAIVSILNAIGTAAGGIGITA